MSGRVWLLVMAFCVAGCADTTFEESNNRAIAPFFFVNKDNPKTVGEIYLKDERDVFRPMEELDLAAREDQREYEREYGHARPLGFETPEPAIPQGCSVRDRFDKDGALAY